jgi:hypothetical protein
MNIYNEGHIYSELNGGLNHSFGKSVNYSSLKLPLRPLQQQHWSPTRLLVDIIRPTQFKLTNVVNSDVP